jgi:hypothetical protein
MQFQDSNNPFEVNADSDPMQIECASKVLIDNVSSCPSTCQRVSKLDAKIQIQIWDGILNVDPDQGKAFEL